VTIIYSDPKYFQTGLEVGITKLSWKTTPDFLADMPLIIRRELQFVQDGCPANFSLVARRYLNRMFPGQWISRRGPIAWPPRSSHLNQLDFYLWGNLKSMM
jgi:hypothetical protein